MKKCPVEMAKRLISASSMDGALETAWRWKKIYEDNPDAGNRWDHVIAVLTGMRKDQARKPMNKSARRHLKEKRKQEKIHAQAGSRT